MPFIERWMGLYLGEDGTATEVEAPAVMLGQTLAEAQDAAFEAFCALLRCKVWAATQPAPPKAKKATA